MGETGYSHIISVRNSESVIPLGEFGQPGRIILK
jgi:hypothetical protein